MTNRPKNRLRALDNGHGPPAAPPHGVPMIDVPQQVRYDPVQVADRIASSVQPGQPFPLGPQAMIALPDFGAIHAQISAALPVPWTGDNIDHLGLLGALALYQTATAAIFARWRARHAPQTTLPDAPPAVVEPDPEPIEPENMTLPMLYAALRRVTAGDVVGSEADAVRAEAARRGVTSS